MDHSEQQMACRKKKTPPKRGLDGREGLLPC
jgi:hypothetical protein